MSIEAKILEYLQEKETWIFCIKEMLPFGDYKSVAKAIERLTIKGDIKRLMQGVYYYPLVNKTFHLEYPPEMEDVAEALGRNNNWEIRETGSTALYKLGLDNQIPLKYVYLSSGPYRTYSIGSHTIEFKNSAQKSFAFSRKTSLIVQAIKALGKSNISHQGIIKMSSFLNESEKHQLLNEMQYAPIWMHSYIKDIGGRQNEYNREIKTGG